ncbi:translation initiation factor IF-2, partial [Streptomyces sp. DfronAA-171]
NGTVRRRFEATAYTLCVLMARRTSREAAHAAEHYLGVTRRRGRAIAPPEPGRPEPVAPGPPPAPRRTARRGTRGLTPRTTAPPRTRTGAGPCPAAPQPPGGPEKAARPPPARDMFPPTASARSTSGSTSPSITGSSVVPRPAAASPLPRPRTAAVAVPLIPLTPVPWVQCLRAGHPRTGV